MTKKSSHKHPRAGQSINDTRRPSTIPRGFQDQRQRISKQISNQAIAKGDKSGGREMQPGAHRRKRDQIRSIKMCRLCGEVASTKHFNRHLERWHDITDVNRGANYTLQEGNFVQEQAVWATGKEHPLQSIEDPLKFPLERAQIENFCWEMLVKGFMVPYRWQRYGQPGYRKLFEHNGKPPVLYKATFYQYFLVLYSKRQYEKERAAAANAASTVKAAATATATVATQTTLSGIQYDTFNSTCKSLMQRNMEKIQRYQITLAHQERVLLEQRHALNKLIVQKTRQRRLNATH